MLDITQFSSYREIIKAICREKKIKYRDLSQATRIHTSYFSRVMVEKANFSQEQLYLIATFMDLKDWRLDYFLLLGIRESSGHSEHGRFIDKKLEKIKEKYSKLINRLDNVKDQRELTESDRSNYYQKSVTAQIHMYLTVEKYRNNLSLICKKLNISKRRLDEEILKLAHMGIIEVKKDKIIMKQFSVQLAENDPLSILNHINWRLEVINKIRRDVAEQYDYHFSAVFSTDYSSKGKIKELFKKFVVEAQKEASKVKSDEEVFAITFDLF